jgi:hypothetical protein
MKLSDALILIDEIRKQGYYPNDWEKDFITSIELRKSGLSYKQQKYLEAIYEKAVGGGRYQRG